MQRRLPAEAFQHYLGLGVGRSYRAVAERFGVAKGTVVTRAKQEGWQERIAEFERTAREQFEADIRQEMKLVRERQLKAARALQAKAIEVLREEPLKAIKAASALNTAWKHELLLLGEVTDRNASVVEEVTRREMRELLLTDGEAEDWSAFEGEGESQGQGEGEAAAGAEASGLPEPDDGTCEDGAAEAR